MCSYNAVCTPGVNDGQCVPSCANAVFNNNILRSKLGFSGMIVSDCSAVYGIGPAQHNFTTPDKVSGAALRAGTDLDCGSFYATHVVDDLQAGRIAESDIDRALNRTITQLITLGLANTLVPAPWSDLGLADIDNANNRRLALDAARQGFVLLKNRNQTLPLKAKHSGKLKIAVLGPSCL